MAENSNETCDVEDCTRPAQSYRWCHAHYARIRRVGHPQPDKPIAEQPPRPTHCSVAVCDEAHYARGWCQPHYNRVVKFGDPQADKPIGRYRNRPPTQLDPEGDQDTTPIGADRPDTSTAS